MIDEVLAHLVPESLRSVSVSLVIAKIIGVVAVYLVARVSIRVIIRIIRRADDAVKSYDLSAHSYRVLGNIISFGVYFIALLMVFSMFGLLPAVYTLLTAAGFIGIVVGFGLKEVLSNFVSGIILAVEQPFKLGDEIEVKSFGGVVDDISIRMTTIKLWDGRLVYIPNMLMLTEPVINLNRSGKRQVETQLKLDARQDFKKTVDAIKTVFKDSSIVLANPEPAVIIEQITPNEINVKLRFWFDVKKTSYQAVKSSVMEEVKRKLG